MKVTVTFEADFESPFPTVYNPDAAKLKEEIEMVVGENTENLLWLDTSKRTGLFHRDLFKNTGVKVEVTESQT